MVSYLRDDVTNDAVMQSVFELPGGGGGLGGLNPPPVVCSTPPNKMTWDTLGGQFQPSAVVNDAESPVCNDNDNE
jgi:hypothetical protein